MVAVLEVLVLPLLVVPLQLPTLQPLVGVAEREIESPAWYCPEAQPDALAGEALGSLPEPVCVRDSV